MAGAREALLVTTVAKAERSYDKLDQDIRGRLSLQTSVVRVCRTLNFMLVGKTPSLAVINELVYLVYFESIPTLLHMQAVLAAELPLCFKELATAAINALLVDVDGVRV